MNSSQQEISPAAGHQDEVSVSLIVVRASPRADLAEVAGAAGMDLEAAMTQRAEAMTHVLARIIEQPPAFRHWGLNE